MLRIARRWGLTPSQFRALPDDDRELMLAEDELVCPSCGHLRSVCSDPEVDWFAHRTICRATAAQQVVQRKVDEKHKDHRPGPEEHPTDGQTIWVAPEDLDPTDDGSWFQT